MDASSLTHDWDARTRYERALPTGRWRDAVAVCVLAAVCLVIFGAKSHLLGFYFDDSGFMIYTDQLTPRQVLSLAAAYLPGRNLHIIWQYSIYGIFGSDVDALPRLHWLQAVASTGVVLLVYAVVRTVGCPPAAAAVGAAVFAFYPNHSEVQFWPSALPMNIASTALALAFLLSMAMATRFSRTLRFDRFMLIIGLGVVAAGLAMFTYDQPVPLIMLVAAAAGVFLLVRDRAKWPAVALIWGGTGAFFLANVIAKAIDPTSGPNFGNIGLEHIQATLWESIHGTFGAKFWNNLMPPELTSRLTPGLVFSGTLAAALVGVLPIALRAKAETWPSKDRNFKWHPALLLAVSIIVFFVGYLTNYLWYIAARHNYLPSLAIALAISAIATWFFRLARDRPVAFATAHTLVGVLAGAVTGLFALNVLASKELWISSYQVRKNFFTGLAEHSHIDDETILVLWGFPRYFGFEIAVFAHEKHFSVPVITGGKARVRQLLEGGVPGTGRLFYNTEAEKDRRETFKFVQTETYLEASFEGLDNDRVLYTLKNKRTQPAYVIRRLDGSLPSLGRPPGNGVVEFTVPDVALKEGEVLVGIPMQGIAPVAVPAVLKQPNGYSTLNIAEVPCTNICAGRYRLEDMRLPRKVTGVELYAASTETNPRLLATVAAE